MLERTKLLDNRQGCGGQLVGQESLCAFLIHEDTPAEVPDARFKFSVGQDRGDFEEEEGDLEVCVGSGDEFRDKQACADVQQCGSWKLQQDGGVEQHSNEEAGLRRGVSLRESEKDDRDGQAEDSKKAKVMLWFVGSGNNNKQTITIDAREIASKWGAVFLLGGRDESGSIGLIPNCFPGGAAVLFDCGRRPASNQRAAAVGSP